MPARMLAIHPVLSVADVRASARWYCDNLGFSPLFADDDAEPRYGGIGRDGLVLHLQWHSKQEWDDGLDGAAYRFLVDDPDAMYAEVADRDVLPPGKVVADTPWGTREFGLYDPDGNALFFYRDR